MSYDTINKQFTGVAATEVLCWCGIAFAIPETLYLHYKRQNDYKTGSGVLHCPLGHEFTRSGRSEADILRDKLIAANQREEQAKEDAAQQRRLVTIRERQIAARKGQLTKLRKRVEKGVCPCCNRYFQNLHRHMNTQHPKWTPVVEDAK